MLEGLKRSQKRTIRKTPKLLVPVKDTKIRKSLFQNIASYTCILMQRWSSLNNNNNNNNNNNKSNFASNSKY